MKKLLLVTTTIMMSAPAFAADGFGDRFGSSAPYALSDGMDSAIADTQGFGMDDLNDPAALNQIDPAAGEEDAQAQEVELESDIDVEADANVNENAVSTSKEPEVAPTEVDTATETESETGSAKVEPAAGSAENADAIDGADTEAGVSANAEVTVED